MSEAVWLGLIGILALVVKEYFDYKKWRISNEKAEDKAKEMKEAALNAARQVAEELAREAEMVRERLGRNTEANKAAVAEVAEKVEEVHKATNSVKDQLLALTDKEAHARGVKDERERAGRGHPDEQST